jgi:hypothetical protein
MDSARHVIGCRLTQDTMVQNACDDVASTNHQSLEAGSAERTRDAAIAETSEAGTDGYCSPRHQANFEPSFLNPKP